MKYVEIVAEASSTQTLIGVADKVRALDVRFGPIGDDGMRQARLLLRDDRVQETLDLAQTLLGAQAQARVIVLPVEAVVPKPELEEEEAEDKAPELRETLLSNVERNCRLDRDVVGLIFLSALVATIGLIEDSPAVVIGAMVIAPLLGPNLALSLGTALGELKLVRQSARTLLVGVLISLAVSIGVGLLWPSSFAGSHELGARTLVGMDSVALALASGAAAALSLTTGLSSVLVGVMVAVALLPPAAAVGLMVGSAHWQDAVGAALLLAVNIVCINLAAKLVFLAKGIHPRKGVEAERARKVTIVYVIGWLITLACLMLAIYAKQVYLSG
ncbi:TIGR00341 family protein [Nitrogeniibacter mangrovi]|uniref:TIGR00341 family protein n=1 Tax=Nitrogeniibacter mangrovi TaxID=2016596 RepID=A0A6C1B4Z7_9RHOO|nr:TIGR00341 family protein [Nitrogeniibacter mangrovi]QID17284.1 TIGR00341 family protein [Nitrogeniibacter mangrovi]